MRSSKLTARAGTGLLAVALGAVLALVPGAQAQHATGTAACTPVSNIEAIIDDSGSMSFTDPSRLRVAALDLLIETPGNEGITLGALEFGGAFLSGETGADTLFGPAPIGPNAKAMEAALNEKIHADNGLTDYNAAFKKAKEDDPGAKAWIFLTDGGHDIGNYENGHRGGPPTYVVGFSSAISGADGARLKQIADETGGKYFPQTDSSNLQAVINQVGTELTCQTPPTTFKDAFKKVGQSKLHKVALVGKVKSAQLALSWASPLDAFTIAGLRVVRHNKTVAQARVKKIKVTKRQGTTFLIVKLTGLAKGSLRFSVRATKLGSGGAGGVKLTSQVTQSH
jgi:hypothetical protein